MQTHITVTPVETYPGIWNVRSGAAQRTIAHGFEVSSETITIENFGEDLAMDFPAGFLPVHSWILAWAVYVHPIVAWLGSSDQWVKLVLRSELQVAGGPNWPTENAYVLPLTTNIIGVSASGEIKIHARAARLVISNDTGQSQTITWDAYAKAE